MADGVPIGVFRQVPALGGQSTYEVLGLAFVEKFDGTHFVLKGEPIDWTKPPQPEHGVPAFVPFEPEAIPYEPSSRLLRDKRFGMVIRRIYREKCSLCAVGYRFRGRTLGLDAAHIIPIDQQGNVADVRNGLLLCRNHHSLFDGFAWTMDEDMRVVITPDPDFRHSAAANHMLSWEGKRLPNLPGLDEDLPATEAVRWRLEQFSKI